MEATSMYIKTEIEDAEYERSYNYSTNDTLANNEEDYTVTVNPEAVLDIKYEREEEPSSNDLESTAALSSDVSGLTGENNVSDSLEQKESPVHNVNRRKRKLRVRRRDTKQMEESSEEPDQIDMDSRVKTEPEEVSTIWKSGGTDSFDDTAIKMESTDNGFTSDANHMDGSSNGTTEISPEEDYVIKTEYTEEEEEGEEGLTFSSESNHVQNPRKRKRKHIEERADAFENIPIGNMMSLQEFEAEKSILGKRKQYQSAEPKDKTRKTWYLDEDKGMWKRRSWYEEEAKNMMQKNQEDLKQIEELYSSKSSVNILPGKKKEILKSILKSPQEKPETKENKRDVRRKRSRYEEKTELMKRKTEEDAEYIDSLIMFKRPGDTSEHSNQSIESTSSATPTYISVSSPLEMSQHNDRPALLSTSLLTLTELSEINEKRRGINKVPIEEDKWKELSKRTDEELEQETVSEKRPRKSIYEEKMKDMNRKTQKDEELINSLQSLRKLVSKDSKEYKQLLNETSVLSDNVKDQVENTSSFEYQPAPGVPIKNLYVPAEPSQSWLIPLRWETDESLGDMAEHAPVLYCNKNYPDLKEKIPQWNLRAPMIGKIWRDLPERVREAYKAQCKQNKLKKEENQKKMLEEELKKHSTKKTKQTRPDSSYRASVPQQTVTPVRQSQRLMSKSANTGASSDEGNDSKERSSSPSSGSNDARMSKYNMKIKMLTLRSERDKAIMAKANLPLPQEGQPDRIPGSHYALSMQMMALKTRQEMATLAKLIPQEKVAAIQSRQAIIPKGEKVKDEDEEIPLPSASHFMIENGKFVQNRFNGSVRTSDSPPVQKDVNLNQNSVFSGRKSHYNEEPEKSETMEDSVLMCSECGEEFTSVSDMDSHKTLSHNYKPSVVLPKEDTALPFIKFEPVDEDFDKIENAASCTVVEKKEKKRKGKGKLKVKVGKNKNMSSDEAQTSPATCDTDIKVKEEVV